MVPFEGYEPVNKIPRQHPLTPISQEEHDEGAVVAKDTPAPHPAHFFGLMLPTKSIDQWPTRVDLPAFFGSSFDQWPTRVDLPAFFGSSPRQDGLSIDQQSTVKVVIPDSTFVGREGYLSLMRTLVKSSGIYALSSLASPLVSLILTPLLTRSLSHNDYGALAVLNTAIALMAGLSQLSLSNAFFRAYSFDYESQRDRLRVLSTLVALLVLVSIPVAIAIYLAAPWLSIFLLKSPAFSGSIRLAAWVILLQNLSVPGFAWLRAENRALFFALLSILSLLVSLCGTIILVAILHMGIDGSLMAVGGSYAAATACLLPIILLRAGLRLRLDIAWNLLSFGLPLVFDFVSVWILQLADRYLLAHLGTLAQTASYSVAYTLAGISGTVVLSPFSLAWPSAMFTIAKRKDAPQVFRLVFRWFSIVLLFATFGLSLLAIVTLDLLFPSTYHSAASIIPIIAASVMFYGIYNIFMTGVSVRRKTWFAVIFTSLSALVNVLSNLILIPRYGSMGAAISTLIAYMLLTVIGYIVNQRIYPVPFEVGKFIIALLVGVAFYVGSRVLAEAQGTYVACAISLGALILYGAFLVFLGKPPISSRKFNKRARKVPTS